MRDIIRNFLIYNKNPHLARWDIQGNQDNEREHRM